MEPGIELSRQALDEFKSIYREEYGEDISDAEATEIATRLLSLFRILSSSDLRDTTGGPAVH
jgi:hypothetical protein